MIRFLNSHGHLLYGGNCKNVWAEKRFDKTVWKTLIAHLRVSIPSGLRLILAAALSLQPNQSSADSVGLHVTRVGGNKSSWNSSLYRVVELNVINTLPITLSPPCHTLMRGTVKLSGSIVVFVNL